MSLNPAPRLPHPATPWVLGCALALGLSAPGITQNVVQRRGVDPRVDYAGLVRFGPWDDRNYALTADDLALLADDEEQLRDPIPAFFRVELRRSNPNLRRSGPAQYPRSALQIFEQLYRGYQIDGRFYRGLVVEDGHYRVLLDQSSRINELGAEPEEELKFLAGDVRVTSPEGAAESAIKISPTNPNLVIAGSNGPGSGQKMHYSTDGGATWNAAAALPLGGTCCDPTVEWSSDGALAHAATLGNCTLAGCSVWYYRSSDGGQNWNDLETLTPGDPRRELTAGGSDKEYLHVDKSASSAYLDNLYMTWHDNNVLQLGRSSDNGDTWSTQSFASDPLGIGSDITTDKTGGVYYFWPAFNNKQIVLKKSTDGGASFASGVTVVAATQAAFTFPVPSMDVRQVFVYVSADADLGSGPYAGSVYVAWTDATATTTNTATDNHARIQVAYSRNGGATWSTVTPHETADQNTVDRYHPWLAVGPDGTVHVAFYDTRRSAMRTSVDVYYAYSTDGAQTFSAPARLTSVQSPKITNSFEFGDYNGLDAVLTDAIAIFTDNRQEGAGTGNSVDVYAAGHSPVNSPEVSITQPSNGSSFPQGSNIAFAGAATDVEDGDLTASLIWTSSLDGPIGSGGTFSTVLSPGTHTITAEATDSDSLTGSDSIVLTVESNCYGQAGKDFEGSPTWTTSGLWHLSENSSCASPGYSSPTHAMYFGQEPGCTYDTGAPVSGDLIWSSVPTLGTSAKLSFEYFRSVEQTATLAVDKTEVAVSIAGQGVWTTVWSKSSLNASENAWTSSAMIDLAAFGGSPVDVRFRFDSVDRTNNDFVGWLIDDVSITGVCPAADLIFSDGFESGDTSKWSFSN